MRTLKIGVVGYSGQKFNAHDANEMLAEALNAVLADHPDATDVWIVSGLTDLGIPALAYRAASIGGGKQSLAEVKTFSETGGRAYEYELAAIPS